MVTTHTKRSEKLLYTVSDTGLEVMVPQDMTSDKQVGLFYFLWQGTEGDQPVYDNTDILSRIQLSETVIRVGEDQHPALRYEDWQAAGGGAKGQFHWWGQPLFGYYDMRDEWVISRHLRMIAQAGVDFIVLDQTNGVRRGYVERILTIFRVADRLRRGGVRVPQIAVMAYDDGPATVNTLYHEVYEPHPEWADLFYHWNGHEKPVMFDNIESYSKSARFMIDTAQKLASYDEGVTDMFEIRDVSFPHETKNSAYAGKGLLYMDFRDELTPVSDEDDGGYSFLNVSVAEICWWGNSIRNVLAETPDHSRNWDGQRNREWHGEPDAWRHGYNFAREWRVVMEKDPDMVFITGWNEWIAQLQVRANGYISLIDNADINNSRDIEPMSGGYGDNYYLQMCRYIAQFKYGDVEAAACGCTTIQTATDWEREGVLRYDLPVGEAGARRCQEANNPCLLYTAPAADNDISRIYIAADDSATYFRVDTAEAVKDAQKDGNLVLLVKTGDKTYAVNRTGGTATTATVEELVDGAWNKLGEATCRIEGNSLSVAVPTDLIPNGDALYIKWVDGLADPSDRMAYYTCPEAAPYGGLFLAFQK